MMHFHSMISLELVALVIGVALLIFIKNQHKYKSSWPIYVAWFVIVMSSLSIVCSAVYTIKFWNDGYPYMHKKMMMYKKMMEKEGRMNDKDYMNQNEEKTKENVSELTK